MFLPPAFLSYQQTCSRNSDARLPQWFIMHDLLEPLTRINSLIYFGSSEIYYLDDNNMIMIFEPSNIWQLLLYFGTWLKYFNYNTRLIDFEGNANFVDINNTIQFVAILVRGHIKHISVQFVFEFALQWVFYPYYYWQHNRHIS
jgi:hypothetical protein